jgi:GH15 family glucan-1,4-alpha-glucosidase
MNDLAYNKAIQLLYRCSKSEGFLASAQNKSNYQRVWARDGVICGMAALTTGDVNLITTFKNTIETLANSQHSNGTIPSNVSISGNDIEVSYGGLAGRVDAQTWFIIGICQIAYYENNISYLNKYQNNIKKCLFLLETWEFNNKHLIYVPLSGNWADEYIADGYVLYDQLLRVWALRSYNHFLNDAVITEKIEKIIEQIEINFTPNSIGEKYHDRIYNNLVFDNYMPCSFSPSGYKTQYDAFANSLALILNIGSDSFQEAIINYTKKIQKETILHLIPAFWPPIYQDDFDWHLLINNYKYEFRNFPNEFHNAGSWPMVNGFWGLAFIIKGKKEEAKSLLDAINNANSEEDFSFYENFNTQTSMPNGVPFCAWSAAATIFLHQSLTTNFKFLI